MSQQWRVQWDLADGENGMYAVTWLDEDLARAEYQRKVAEGRHVTLWTRTTAPVPPWDVVEDSADS